MTIVRRSQQGAKLGAIRFSIRGKQSVHETTPTARTQPTTASTVQPAVTVQQSSGPPPGWYIDPNVSGQWRWWNGTAWTERMSPNKPG
ncbi:MAG: DUF2510 domain-containing protein [Acidimicrobiales bacterium]